MSVIINLHFTDVNNYQPTLHWYQRLSTYTPLMSTIINLHSTDINDLSTYTPLMSKIINLHSTDVNNYQPYTPSTKIHWYWKLLT